jgi:hypothetical protein
VSDCYVLLCIAVVVGAGIRVVRSTVERPVRTGRRAMAPSGAGT